MRSDSGQRLTGLTLLLVLMQGLGCATGPKTAPVSAPPTETGAPTEQEVKSADRFSTLLVLSETRFDRYGPVETNREALAAAREALAIEPENGVAGFLAAQAVSWLLEFDTSFSEDEALALAREGRGYAELALAADGEQVGPVFLAGALLGQELLHGNSPGLVKMRKVEDRFERAVAIDPTYDQGAPYRALGTLLIKAPPWPVGVGDEERGLELLEEGRRQFPEHPANHLFLGDGQVATGRKKEAAGSYERVLSLCLDERWGTVCEIYALRAESALEKLR